MDDALEVLTRFEKTKPRPPIHQAWVYWLSANSTGSDPALLAAPAEPAFQFPYRNESHGPISVAAGRTDHWVWDYLVSLQSWAGDQDDVATGFFIIPDNEPAFAPYYVSRAHLLARTRNRDPEADLRKAVELEPDARIFHVYLIQHLEDAGKWDAALTALDAAKRRFPDDFDLDLLRARALINLGRPQEAAGILADTNVLPSEGARDSHRFWEQAHVMAALDAYDAGDFQEAKAHVEQAMEWPENLGQGRPYEPDERLARFILGHVEGRLGNPDSVETVQALRPQLEAMAQQTTSEVQRGLIRRALSSLSHQGLPFDSTRP
jgi:tetratricopeptide (TPR) repeat protein